MVKIDLITGFLGSGKTTFIKKYADYLIRQGCSIGILENDYGAINVDMMLRAGDGIRRLLSGFRCAQETFQDKADLDGHVRL